MRRQPSASSPAATTIRFPVCSQKPHMDSILASAAPHTPAATQPEVSYVPSEGENELILLSREWMRAAFAHDDVTLRRLMAPEYTLQVWDASRAAQNLETWMTTLIHRLRDVKFDYTSINARVLGDVGIVGC